MLGTLAEAKKALGFVRSTQEHYGYAHLCRDDVKVPRTWKVLGSGVDRIGILAPSGTVYKVEWEPSKRAANLNEYMTILFLAMHSLIPDNIDVRLPRVTRYSLPKEYVLAMEYFPSSGPFSSSVNGCVSLTSEQRKFAYAIGICDPHSGNYRIDSEGKVVFIDYGFAEDWRQETDDDRSWRANGN